MSKRVAVKLAVTVAAVCAMTVLQGCEGENDDLVLRSAWTPAGYPWTMFNYFGYDQSITGDSGQGTTAGSGGSTVSSAISSGMGGSGGQVSGGAGF